MDRQIALNLLRTEGVSEIKRGLPCEVDGPTVGTVFLHRVERERPADVLDTLNEVKGHGHPSREL